MHTVQTTLICNECGNIFPIMRKEAKQKKSLHVKDLYCPKCMKVTKHLETKDWYIVYEMIASKDEEKRSEEEQKVYTLIKKGGYKSDN